MVPPPAQTPAALPASTQNMPIDSNNLAPDGGGGRPTQRGRRYSENPGAGGKKRGVSPVSVDMADLRWWMWS